MTAIRVLLLIMNLFCLQEDWSFPSKSSGAKKQQIDEAEASIVQEWSSGDVGETVEHSDIRLSKEQVCMHSYGYRNSCVPLVYSRRQAMFSLSLY